MLSTVTAVLSPRNISVSMIRYMAKAPCCRILPVTIKDNGTWMHTCRVIPAGARVMKRKRITAARTYRGGGGGGRPGGGGGGGGKALLCTVPGRRAGRIWCARVLVLAGGVYAIAYLTRYRDAMAFAIHALHIARVVTLLVICPDALAVLVPMQASREQRRPAPIAAPWPPSSAAPAAAPTPAPIAALVTELDIAAGSASFLLPALGQTAGNSNRRSGTARNFCQSRGGTLCWGRLEYWRTRSARILPPRLKN